jgi:hypothetical protein
MTTDRYRTLLPRPRTARRAEGSYELTPETPLVAFPARRPSPTRSGCCSRRSGCRCDRRGRPRRIPA